MRQPSRQQLLALALCSAVCLISAVPLPQPAGNQELDVLQIPLANGKEIDVLTLGAKDQEQLIADRNKRTIGLLRELFPDITKEIDSIVNRIIAQVIRVAGPGVLNSILAGNRGGAAGAGGRSTTPASDFDADFDADFDEEDDVPASSSSSPPATGVVRSPASEASNEVEGSSRVKIDLPTFAPESAAAAAAAAKGDESPLITTTTSTTQSAIQSSIPTSTSPSPSNPTTSIGDLTDLVDPLVQLLPRSLEPESSTTTTTTTTSTTTTPATSTTTSTSTTTTTEPPPTEPPTTTTTTTSTTIQFPTNNSIEEPQLLTIIADINRLLNSTNYFITTRDNITTTTTTVATTIDNNNITKLLPVFD
ncbi:platelet glycoprotein Ib alpha chain isoform X1 [Drosophila kikkawai]|uniref:Platelet glycoprotein Ib alpha chain isoform X1 n=1 Tax=Drosophila kikkawai TaxID=30033 RepID=A0A6P4J6X1_DROKI|nr:cell wall protein DAN4 isoform X1 [Drosophila kikkawai]